LSPLKKPITPYYFKIVELVSRKFLYFIYIGLSEHIAIFNLGSNASPLIFGFNA